MKNQKRTRSIFLGIAVSLLSVALFSFSNSVFAAGSGFQVYALDTVAGASTSIKTSSLSPNTEVLFAIQKPDAEIIKLSSVANVNGVARVDFSDYYTRKAGEYRVTAYTNNMSVASDTYSFTVYPSTVSVDNSTISPENQVLRNLDGSAIVTVKLVDDYGNPIEGHLVKLLPSKSDAIVSYKSSSISDKNGELSFLVSSADTDTVVYTAYDVSSDLVLSSRARVAYFDSFPDSYQYAAGNSSGPVHHFIFEDVPATIYTGDTVSFTVTAVDSAGQTVVDYLGSVRFSAFGDNADLVNLPADYSFVSADLGSHTFSLALGFQQPGSYEIEARDISSTSVFASRVFDVIQGSSAVSPGDSSAITIANPVPGTYSNNIVVVSGFADPAARLKIFDNNIELTNLIADIDGRFSYTTPTLVDGLHQIYVASVNDVGTLIDISDTVEFTIDTEAPEISQVVIQPGDVIAPGDIATVKLYTDDSLSRALLTINNNVYELSDTGQGYYEASFVVPTDFAQYPISFSLIDQLGNEAQFPNQITLTVGSGVVSEGLIGDVSGLLAEVADSRVILNWNEVPSTNLIRNYRVYYGTSPNQLIEAVDTFTNATTWYVPNLQNGTMYYFAVVAVDEFGNSSQNFSDIVAATPSPAVIEILPPDVINGVAGAEALEDMDTEVSETGPDILWLLLLSFVGGAFYLQFHRFRLNANISS